MTVVDCDWLACYYGCIKRKDSSNCTHLLLGKATCWLPMVGCGWLSSQTVKEGCPTQVGYDILEISGCIQKNALESEGALFSSLSVDNQVPNGHVYFYAKWYLN